jgi:hypothetical protein
MTLPQRSHFIYETHREIRDEFIKVNLRGQQKPEVRVERQNWEGWGLEAASLMSIEGL